jgi:hypothetical protein
MNDPNKSEHSPVMHEPMEFDMAADRDLSDVPVLETYSLGTILHPAMEFDAAESAWVALTFRHDTGNTAAAEENAAVVLALDQYDRALGGRGLVRDPTRSSESDGQVCLVLRPIVSRGAAERFGQMAAALGCPMENGAPQCLAAGGRLQEILTHLVQHADKSTPSLDAIRTQLRRPGFQLTFGSMATLRNN